MSAIKMFICTKIVKQIVNIFSRLNINLRWKKSTLDNIALEHTIAKNSIQIPSRTIIIISSAESEWRSYAGSIRSRKYGKQQIFENKTENKENSKYLKTLSLKSLCDQFRDTACRDID